MIQWLRLCLPMRGESLILGWEATIPHAWQPKNQDIKQKKYCNKFIKTLKNDPYQKSFFKKICNTIKMLICAFVHVVRLMDHYCLITNCCSPSIKVRIFFQISYIRLFFKNHISADSEKHTPLEHSLHRYTIV